MIILVHLLLFLFSLFILWFFAGVLIEAVDAVAKRFNYSGFTVAFFVLGFLTSIGEISVMINSSIDGVPQISAGNLIGASFVILLFIVPVLAIVGKEIHLKNTLSRKQLALALLVALLPVLLVLDGNIQLNEGIVCLLAYASLLYLIQEKPHTWWRRKQNSAPEVLEKVTEELAGDRHATRNDILKIAGGALIIFLAGDLLVGEAVYFSEILRIPSSIVGLLLLSIGTNIPELVIAIRAISKKNVDIAFGDYLGSVTANSAIFGILVLINGEFVIEASSFYITAGLMILGFAALYVFARTKDKISRDEGIILLLFYVLFIVSQFSNLLWFLHR